VKEREPVTQTPIALPALLAALLGLMGAAGADILAPIALAIVLLPACEAVSAARNAAVEGAALADFPRRPRRLRRRAVRLFFPVFRACAARHRGALHGVALPLLA